MTKTGVTSLREVPYQSQVSAGILNEELSPYSVFGLEPLVLIYLKKELQLFDGCLPKEADKCTLFERRKGW